MRRLLDTIYTASGYLAALFIAAICILVMAQVMLNLIDRTAALLTGQAIGLTIPSYSDFTGFFLAAASFLALAYTLRVGGHIRVTLFTNMLGERTQKVLEIWSLALAAAMTIFVTFYSIALTHESFVYNDLSSGMVAVPIWIPQSSVSIGMFVLSVALVDEFIGVLAGKTPSYAGKGENLLDEPGEE